MGFGRPYAIGSPLGAPHALTVGERPPLALGGPYTLGAPHTLWGVCSCIRVPRRTARSAVVVGVSVFLVVCESLCVADACSLGFPTSCGPLCSTDARVPSFLILWVSGPLPGFLGRGEGVREGQRNTGGRGGRRGGHCNAMEAGGGKIMYRAGGGGGMKRMFFFEMAKIRRDKFWYCSLGRKENFGMRPLATAS